MNMNFVQQCRHRPPEMGVTRGGPVACRSPSGEPLAVSTMKESLTLFFRRSPSPRARIVGAEPRLHVYHDHVHTGAYIHPTYRNVLCISTYIHTPHYRNVPCIAMHFYEFYKLPAVYMRPAGCEKIVPSGDCCCRQH